QAAIDLTLAVGAPAEDPAQESPHRDQSMDLGDEAKAADPDLDARRQHERSATGIVEPQAILALEIGQRPDGPVARQARMPPRDVATRVAQLDRARRARADEPLTGGRGGKLVCAARPPFAKLDDVIIKPPFGNGRGICAGRFDRHAASTPVASARPSTPRPR